MESVEPFSYRALSQEDTRNEIRELNRQELLRANVQSTLRRAMSEGDRLLDIFENRNLDLEPQQVDNLDDEEALVAIGGLLKYHFIFTNGMDFEWPQDSTDAQDKVFTIQDELTIDRQSPSESAGAPKDRREDEKSNMEISIRQPERIWMKSKRYKLDITGIDLYRLLGNNEFESLKQIALASFDGQEHPADEQEVDSALKYILSLFFNTAERSDKLPKERVLHLKYLDYYKQWIRQIDFNDALRKDVVDVYSRAVNLVTRTYY